MALVLLFTLVAWMFVSCQGQSYEIAYNEPSKCTANQYFQFSSLECLVCGTGQKRSIDGLSCVCQAGFKFVGNSKDANGPIIQCESCSTNVLNKTASLDGSFCIECPTQVGFDLNTGLCNDCPTNSFPSDRTPDGAKRLKRVCIACTAGQTAPWGIGEGSYCKRCHPSFTSSFANLTLGGCTCNCADCAQTGGVCLSNSNLIREPGNDNIYSISYSKSDKIVSYYFKENFRAVQALCRDKFNLTACQLLGNLCTLLTYNLDVYKLGSTATTDACKEYYDLVIKAELGQVVNLNRQWPKVSPWLYYGEGSAVGDLNRKDITTKFRAGQTMQFTLAEYNLNGSFYGVENGTVPIQLCQDRPSKMAAADNFATTFRFSCFMSIKSLMDRHMLFYDMYMLTGNQKMYPIPVLVDNYETKGELVNQKQDRTEWQLVRRFFLVDNVVGKTGEQENLKFLRYAQSIEMVIRLRSTDGEIYPPLLKVKYSTKDVSDKLVVETGSVEVSFAVSYEMDFTKIIRDIEIAIGCLSAVALLLTFVKTYGWYRRRGGLTIDCGVVMKFIVFAFGCFSTMYFWILVGMAAQSLLFFKRQEIVYQLLPTDSQDNLFLTLLIICFVFKFFDVVHMFWMQINIDIFFLDWEKPRGKVTQPNQGGETGLFDAPVSIWRTFFVANEWNEIQTIRKINQEFQIFGVLFFLKVVGFEHLATTDPVSRFSVNTQVDYVGQQSHILRFALLVIIYLVIEALQWFYFAFIYERFIGDSLGDFVDLCSMSNISIIIMENTRYGYYIHGRSVHGRADTNMKEMNEQLKREEDNLCGQRGLEPNTDNQTFQVTLPQKFRNQYDQIISPLKIRDQQAQRRNMPSTATGGNQSRLPVAVERSIQAYVGMNRFLSAFIDHSLRDVDYLVKDKLLLERIFDVELSEIPLDKAIFYNDDGRSFNSVLFYGNEWTLLLFDILFFALVDFIATDYVLAAVLTYIASKIISAARDSFGRRNLARKTLVDERFLI